MYNIADVYQNVKKFNFSDTFSEFSRVEIDVSDDSYVASGKKTGRTLTAQSPWATKQVAADVLEKVRGFTYQPYTANSVELDPAVELGDGIFVEAVFSGIYTMETRFGKTYVADLSAPSEEEIDHEYPYKEKAQRKTTRRLRNAEATLKVQAEEITAKVSAVDGSSSFSWELTKDYWRIKAKGKTILKVSEDGFWFNGDGTFTGNVYAGNIKSGKSGGVNYGTFNGAGITAGTITRKKMDSDVDKLLDYAGTAGDLFRGATEVGNIWTGRLKVSGVVEMFGYKIGIKTTYIGTERIYYLAPVEDVA